MARSYYFAILPSTASNEVASASMESIFRGRNTLMAVLYFFVWAAVWAWVVQTRGAWNLILANLAGAASGFIVAMIFSVICSSLFPAHVSPSPENLASSVLQMITTFGVLAGVWMWLVRRPRPEHPLARQLFAGICGLAGGVTTLAFFALNFH
ncbi:hypothetical protein [Pseudomonas sp. ok266]|uniref:hypothetical protein n=1 Tax=Pseudomonas sp. ok266 TaxID=1761896 RepID=UPI002113AC36|nr:hypothetical protein [Pseudomonas sp. ok266]